MRRERFAHRPLALVGRNRRGFGGSLFGGEFVLGGCGFQFLQLQFQLIEKAGSALRARTEAVAFELGDDQLEMSDQRLIVGELRLGDGQLGLDMSGMRPRRDQRHLQRVEIVGKIDNACLHTGNIP